MGQHETGLVAFFDILGYQNIIDNNDISSVTHIIDELLTDIPPKVKQKSRWFRDDRPEGEDNLVNLRTQVISDSIILALPLPAKLTEDWMFTYFAWLFGKYCEALLDFTFDNGLPLRGAVDYGEFYLTQNCFAGKPIINCYRTTRLLDFSGCVFTPALTEKYHAPKNKETVRTYSRSLGFP